MNSHNFAIKYSDYSLPYILKHVTNFLLFFAAEKQCLKYAEVQIKNTNPPTRQWFRIEQSRTIKHLDQERQHPLALSGGYWFVRDACFNRRLHHFITRL